MNTRAASSMSPFPNPADRPLRIMVVLAFAIVIAVVASRHEPWRDELEMWIMARDASFMELIRLAPDMGTPLLWPLLLKPIVATGLSVAWLSVLAWVLILLTAILLFIYSPLPFWLICFLFTSYYFGFEYAIVARNYSLGVLLLMFAAALDARRAEHPWKYSICLALLAQTSVHFSFVAGVLCISLAVEIFRARNWQLLAPLSLAGSSLAAVFWLLIPSGSGQFEGTFVSNFRPEALIIAARGAIVPLIEEPWGVAVAAVVWLLFILGLLSRKRTFVLTFASMAGLSYIFCFKHLGGTWHFGLLLVLMVYGIWLRLLEPADEGLSPRIRRLSDMSFRGLQLSLVIALCITMVDTARMWHTEFSRPHSMSSAMAQMMLEGGVFAHRIAAHPAPVTAGILAYAPGEKFWYPGIQNWGTYMRWDRAHALGRFISDREAFKRIKLQFPDWNSKEDPVLYLSNTNLATPERYGYSLYMVSIDTPWRAKDEAFFLYVPSNFLD